ncbi:ketopantoate reductase C-terminal domain-containing protein [Salinisphaera sp. PC39]|uniref:ketopantoate reductase family protein n=1 Tax=Salinisphaera sp. PC39 TaxID=1304156 RepID=UPI003340AB88
MAEHRIVGAGAVGTVLAGFLTAAGESVRLQVRPGRLADYADVERLTVTDSAGQGVVDVPAPPIEDRAGGADYVYLAVKHGGLDAALDALDGHLGENTVLLPCLNGVGVGDRVAARFPGHTVMPVTIMFNARIEAPLAARLTTRPEILFRAAELPPQAESLRRAGMTVGRGDDATEWGKLLINLNNAVCAATATGFADLFGDRHLVRAFVTVLDEAIAVLDAAGIRYDLPVPVPYRVYRWLLLHGRGLPLWVARRKNGLSDEAYPSMLADLRAGRATEIDALNGAIVDLGRTHGVATPANAELIRLIHDREKDGAADPLTPQQLLRRLENA